MTEESPPPLPPPPPKPNSPQDWESLIDDFLSGGARLRRWRSHHDLLDHLLSFLLRKDFSLKLPLLLLLEEFSDAFFSRDSELDRLLDALRLVVQAPLDGAFVTLLFKEQFMVSCTSIFISIDALDKYHARFTESLVELLLTVINRPNHGLDRQTRAVACECLRQLEKCYPCLLSAIAGHLWSLCQSERTHACQCYLLLFTTVIYSIVDKRLSNVSILNTSVPLVPFDVPQWVVGWDPSSREVTGLNHKELKRAIAFLLETPQVLTPSGMAEFLSMIMPVALILELQASLLKVQFFGMIYSFNPLLWHVVLMMYRYFSDALDGHEGEITRRLMLISRETQHNIVFRLLTLHWLLGLLSSFMSNGELEKYKGILKMGLKFYPEVFDPLALKAVKLDLLAFSSICIDALKLLSDSSEDTCAGKSVVKLFEDGLVSVSSFKWLPPWSTETVVAFRAFHKFLIGASLRSASGPSSTRLITDNTIVNTLQGMLVSMTVEFQRLVPVIVSFIDRLLACQNHHWLGESLLQTVNEYLLSKVKLYYKLPSYFPIFERIAETNTIPPNGLLDLLIKFMVFLVQKHGPNTRLRSWSAGSKVLCICRTMLMHHHSSRLFLGLSRLLAFTCLYFPDLEVRDNARIYLRMLICIPGVKLKGILNSGEKLIGISPSTHPGSFYSDMNLKKSRSISSYIHLERMIPLLVKQSWSLSLSSLGSGSSNGPTCLESIRDNEPEVDSSEVVDTVDLRTSSESDRIHMSSEPLRVMDSKISEILGILRRHFSFIPDFRHMPGLKVSIPCSLRFDSASFSHVWGNGSPASQYEGIDDLPAIYATVLKFSSSAPYGSIPPCHIPFLLGEPPRIDDVSGQALSLDIVPVENGIEEEETFKASVMVDLEPREPTPGIVDVFIETNADNGQIINGQLRSVTVGIEDMFLKTIVPPDIPEDKMSSYYSELFDALWEACGASSNLGRETFLLKGGKGFAAISGTQSVKLLEVPVDSLIRATEQHLAPFIVSVIGEQLVNIMKDRGVIRNVIWKEDASGRSSDITFSTTDLVSSPLRLAYNNDDDDEHMRESRANIGKRHMGCFLVLIFLPPRFHLLFQMEVSDLSTLVRIRTDHWPCLAYVDDYLEALFLS